MTAAKAAAKKQTAAAGAGGAPQGKGDTGPGARRRPDAAPRPPGRPTVKAKRAERAAALADQLTAASLGLALIAPADAVAVGRHAEGIADALAQLADQNRLVAKLLDGATAGGAILGVFTAILPLAVELLANHGRLGAMSPMFATPAPTGDDDHQAANVGGLAAMLGGLAPNGDTPG
jgi:hypothetical protein